MRVSRGGSPCSGAVTVLVAQGVRQHERVEPIVLRVRNAVAFPRPGQIALIRMPEWAQSRAGGLGEADHAVSYGDVCGSAGEADVAGTGGGVHDGAATVLSISGIRCSMHIDLSIERADAQGNR
jgi:hypothetical protein